MDEGRGEEEGEASTRIVVGTYVGNGCGLAGGSAHSWRIEGRERPEGYGTFRGWRGSVAHVVHHTREAGGLSKKIWGEIRISVDRPSVIMYALHMAIMP